MLFINRKKFDQIKNGAVVWLSIMVSYYIKDSKTVLIMVG